MKPYYDEDGITIYHGDCREVLPQITGAAVITDPPYGIGKKYGDSYDDVGGPDYWDMIRTVVDLSRKSASVVAMTHRVYALRELSDWDWVGGWVKRNQQTRLWWTPILPTWEPIILWGINGLARAADGRIPTAAYRPDTFTTDAIPSTSVPGGHPFPKPLNLMRDLIQWLAPSGLAVIDPFMGSGTTLRASKDLLRPAIGIEIEERYCEIAAKRLAQGVLDFGAVS